jgi:hypothetical protein
VTRAPLYPDQEVEPATHWDTCWMVHRACAAARIQRLDAALRELVRLKGLKDSIDARRGRTERAPSPSRDYWIEGLEEEYECCKPLAWEAAREALK